MEEEFRPINGWKGYYVSNKGTVISYRDRKGDINPDKFHTLKPDIGPKGYARVTLYIEGQGRYRQQVHKLVAQAFIPNPNNYPCINHKDENPLNNTVENLEWCSYQYNNNYNDKNKKIGDKLRGRPLSKEHKEKCLANIRKGKVKVRCIETNITYESFSEAARTYGSAKSARRICDACKGRYETSFGLHWEEVL